MRKETKKFLSLLLVFAIILSISMTASAYTAPVEDGVEGTLANGYSSDSAKYEIYPIPQSVVYDNEETPTEFYMSDEVNVVYDENTDEATKAFLKEVLEKYGKTVTESTQAADDKTNILVGVKDSGGAADLYFKDNVTIKNESLFTNYNPYAISAKDGTIAILGGDTDSAFYGIATLQMMFSSFAGEKFLTAQIEDYANVLYRGFIEGMYAIWNDEGRESLMRFARDYKMNTYIYASKSDPYHTSLCYELYPEDQINAIAELAKIGEETKCYYAWSAHIAGFFSGLDVSNTEAYEARYAKLLAKFEQLYAAGVRRFAILNDDFPAGKVADVVTLINRLMEEFIKPKGCEMIAYCPNGYNKDWLGGSNELDILSGLDDSIMLFWTGDDVNAPMTQETVDYAQSKFDGDICFWLNYPVNEHGKSGMFLGDITHYARDNVKMKGAVSNPCLYPEASKVALYQLAALWWNNTNYSENAEKIWLSSFKYLQPEVYSAFMTMGRNISNAPGSGRVPQGFPESEYIKAALESVEAKIAAGEDITNDQEVKDLLAEFENIIASVDTMKTSCENQSLVEELTPWFNSLQNVTAAAKSVVEGVIAYQTADTGSAWDLFSQAVEQYDKYDSFTYLDGDGNYSTALAGSKRIDPFVSKTLPVLEKAVMDIVDPDGSCVGIIEPGFMAVLGGNKLGANAETDKLFDGNDGTVMSINTVQVAGDYFGWNFGDVTTLHSIRILNGSTNSADQDKIYQATVEYSVDGKSWTEIGKMDNQEEFKAENLDVQAKFVRVRITGFDNPANPGKKDYWIRLRSIDIVDDDCRIYTNISSNDGITITQDGDTYNVTGISDVVLEKGQYVGIKFPYAVIGDSITAQGLSEGLSLVYSANGDVWKPASEIGNAPVKYAAVINNRDTAVTVGAENLVLGTVSGEIKGKMIENSLTIPLKEGNWDYLFDGDCSTYAWTNEGQAKGQYFIFDLGREMPVNEFKMVFSDNPVKPRLYNAELQIVSELAGEWTTIKTFNNDLVNDYSLEGNYRVAYGDGEGQTARYMRILVGDVPAEAGNPFLRIHEIEINYNTPKAVPGITGTVQGDYTAIADKDLTTLFTASAPANQGDYIVYELTDSIYVNRLVVLQTEDCAGKARAIAVDKDGNEHDLGILSEAINSLNIDYGATPEQNNIVSLKIVYDAGVTPSLYEIVSVYSEPEEPQPEPITNIALNKTVTVSGSEVDGKWGPELAVDGIDNTDDSRWSAAIMNNKDGSEQIPQWFTIDLGEGKKAVDVESIVVKFYKKVWATDYVIETSADGSSWTKVAEKTRANGDSMDIIDTFANSDGAGGELQRYVRFTFNKVNENAAGWSVSVREFEINGRLADAETEPTVVKGDVDKNGTLNIVDATLLQKYLVKLIDADDSNYNFDVADMNNDGILSIMDATLMQVAIANGETTTPTDPTEETTDSTTEPTEETTDPTEPATDPTEETTENDYELPFVPAD